MVYYPTPLHIQTAFAHLAYRPEDFPMALAAAHKIFSLPMHPYLQDGEIEEIVGRVAEVVA
jgi:dTDP-4-amino-4,6-dideoxygalactose transaminase